MLDEIFKDCKYYEELYEVSNYGRVRNMSDDSRKPQYFKDKGLSYYNT